MTACGREGRMSKLKKHEWYVRGVELATAQRLVKALHYAKGGSNTAVYVHGLFKVGDLFDAQCVGVAWWLPPTRSAAEATYPENWKGVLSLSRLVIDPSVPSNACTFLLARSRALIDHVTWPCLVTYADQWQHHTGNIYRADNWTYIGLTKPQRCYQIEGVMVSRKAGPKTRTHAQMLALGAQLVGTFAKHKFVKLAARRA